MTVEIEKEVKILYPGVGGSEFLSLGAKYDRTIDITDIYLKSRYTQRVYKIRIEDGKTYTFIIKSGKTYDDGIKESEERSFSISSESFDEFLSALKGFGLEERFRWYRVREQYILDDMKFHLDHTDDIGHLDILEIEFQDKTKLESTMQKLGIDKSRIDKRTNYDLLCESKLGEHTSNQPSKS
ncbi:MAG TPA: CYTH domain-containing protein [archaeon]|nr:CYTH domain-containing protein [archaeon]